MGGGDIAATATARAEDEQYNCRRGHQALLLTHGDSLTGQLLNGL
jgi:hypothetical protein